MFVAADVPQCFGRLTVTGAVCGIAQLGDDIFVASDSSRSISVFAFRGHEDFEQLEDVTFNELQTPPRDVATNDDYQRLFVADAGSQCVWQLDR